MLSIKKKKALYAPLFFFLPPRVRREPALMPPGDHTEILHAGQQQQLRVAPLEFSGSAANRLENF